MAFLETPRFPTSISHTFQGGPRYQTDIVTLNSGREQAHQRWTAPRHEYDFQYGPHEQDSIDTIIDFFHAVQGRANSFRFKDWRDYKSCPVDETPTNQDQQIGTGDGTTTQFQIIKTYTAGALSYARDITKPVSGTILVALVDTTTSPDTVTPQTEGVDYTVDTTTGVITFTTAPGAGSPPTAPEVWAGYEFDVPCRFDSDLLNMSSVRNDAHVCQGRLREVFL